MSFRHLPLLLVLVSMSACSLKIRAGNPRPNIAIVPRDTTMALVIADRVADTFVIPQQNGIMGGSVQGWHTTLRSGFGNGFNDVFRLSEGPADTTMSIDVAELEFVPAAVSGYYGVIAVNAQVRFKATVTQGGVKRRIAGTAVSKKSIANAAEATAGTVSAVESMYEAIARELFADTASVSSSAPAW